MSTRHLFEDIQITAFALLCASAAVGWFFQLRFLRYLRERHPDSWREVGAPSPWLPGVLFENREAASDATLWGRQFRPPDAKAASLRDRARLAWLIFAIAFAVLVVGLFFR